MKKFINVFIVEEHREHLELFKYVAEKQDYLHVVGHAGSIAEASDSIKHSNEDIDLIILSIDDDIKNISFIKDILRTVPSCSIITAVSDSPLSADYAVKALENGAFDFILVPDEMSELDKIKFENLVVPKIRSFSISFYANCARNAGSGKHNDQAVITASEDDITALKVRLGKRIDGLKHCVLLIGASTGGPAALSEIISSLPEAFPYPVVVVIHMPGNFISSLARTLDKESGLKVRVALADEKIEPGFVYIAPGESHTEIRYDNGVCYLSVIDTEPVNNCKPSVDVLFNSAARELGSRAIAMILTGMGEDGALGLKSLRDRGSLTLAQDEDTSVVWGMPGKAVELGAVDHVLPIHKMSDFLIKVVNNG
ncbi:MAG: chemotaxis protein CheB [Planctomycetota bacterium]|jgi:two-component system chemotaxis response regulator CheB